MVRRAPAVVARAAAALESEAAATAQREEAATLEVLRADPSSRQCDRCMRWITRRAGCAKMQCLCGNQFCFKCGEQGAKCDCTGEEHAFWDNKRGRAVTASEPGGSARKRRR